MKKLILAALIPAGIVGIALSQGAFAGSGTVAVTPGVGATYQTVTNGSGNNLNQSTIWDATAGAVGAAVKAGNAASPTDNALVVADPNLLAAAQAGTYTQGAALSGSIIGIGGKDGSGNAQAPIMSNYGTAPGASPSFGVNAFITNAPVLGAGSAIVGKVGIDQTTPGTTNLVSAGFSQPIADTVPVTNVAYVSGNCMGGFRSITVAANNGQSGYVLNVRVLSEGGVTGPVVLYLFDSNPSGSTCTNAGTFTLANADEDKMIASPQSLTLAASTGSTISFASADFTPPRAFIAGGSTASGVKTIYYALVSGASFTPTANSFHTRTGVTLN